jgi:hypothetical protein
MLDLDRGPRAMWEHAVTNRLSVLVTGPSVATGAFLATYGTRLPLRVLHIACDRPLAFDECATDGTVVLHNIDTLALAWQHELLEWLETEARRTQVVSTTARSLLPLIARGDFLATLFYRLNTIHIQLTVADNHPGDAGRFADVPRSS